MLNLLSKITTTQFFTQLHRVLCLTVVTVLVVMVTLPSPVLAATAYTGTFQVTKSCDATTSISGNNPLPLGINSTYEVVSLNKDQNPTHAYIKVADAGNRWVNLNCGNLSGAIATTTTIEKTKISTETATTAVEFIPFFDNSDNPVIVKVGGIQDLTPIPPQLNKFDLAVNQLCGELGTVVKPADFKAMFKDFPDVLTNIKNNVGGYIVAGKTSDTEFLDDLTDLWFEAEGFDHVFCGEPGATKIGGLHYAGRYLDLQNRQLAGILPASISKAEVEPGAVYSFGVVMKVGDRLVQDPFKGYGLTFNAEEMLEIAAKAYKSNPSLDTTPKACLLTITDDGKTFANVFVAKKGAIRTFYPDATPDYQRTPKCNV